jgi:hypothetical protein
MIVYAVIYDNGEPYEDYEEWVEAIMSTKEKAKNYKPNGVVVGQFNRIEEFVLDEPSNWETVYR